MKKEMTLEELKQWIPQLVKDFSDKQLILLSGSLGAGKTAFTKAVLEFLGCAEASSPTYSLIHEYDVPRLTNCFHVDLYRIEDEDDLQSSGFWEIFTNPSGLIFVEWSDRVATELYPLHWAKWALEIEKGTNNLSRIYSLRKL